MLRPWEILDADVRLQSLLLDFMYDTLQWKVHQERKAVDLQSKL